jgi:penicillin G amidase
VRGRSGAEPLKIRTTRWGPVVDRDGLGRALALRATWLEPGGANLDVLNLILAESARDGVEALSAWSGPALNWMFVDTSGDTGWIANGPLPKRVGFDGSLPLSWADGDRGWQGRLAPPTLINTDDGVMFTANNRTLPADEAAAFGRMWMRPLRAKRIAELLADQQIFDEADFLRMQLDTRAEGYELIRDVALDALRPVEADPLLASVRDAIASWNGRADADTSGFRLLHLYYRALLEQSIGPMLAPAVAADPDFVYRWPLADEPLRRLLEERPPHLLPDGFADWNAFLRRVLVDTVHAVAADPARPDPHAPWGDVNRLDAGHPLAGLPGIGRWLRLPRVPQPGSLVSLRVATPDRGAVIRMVVSPARPEAGILQMSGGQSGHFLSRNFRDQHGDWTAGTPAPFLAGETAASFTLTPAERLSSAAD